MLRTRAPLSRKASSPIPSDLHVLGLPLAFILSQDQTLHCKCLSSNFSWLYLLILWNCLNRILVLFVLYIFIQYPSLFQSILSTNFFNIEQFNSRLTARYMIASFKRTFSLPRPGSDMFYRIATLNFQFVYPAIRSPSFAFQLPSFWDCKGRNLFSFSKFYFKIIFGFPFPSLTPLSRSATASRYASFSLSMYNRIPSFAGCKGRNVFQFVKYFLLFF